MNDRMNNNIVVNIIDAFFILLLALILIVFAYSKKILFKPFKKKKIYKNE